MGEAAAVAPAAPERVNGKFSPPKGAVPVLQFCRPAELHIDPTYQRDISGGPSQALIRRIAGQWDWDLCQPLTVARRRSLTEQLYVIDGQHRLAAARLRGDIDRLPCVIVAYESAAQEAASFVHLNQQRRPLGKLDLFKAALSSGDVRSIALANALADAGLTVAPHMTCAGWKPGMVGNIGGIERAWRESGQAVVEAALRVLAQAFAGQVLRYAGTIFPGIVAVIEDEIESGGFSEQQGEALQSLLVMAGQDGLRQSILATKADNPGLKFARAAAHDLRRRWRRAKVSAAASRPVPAPALAPSPAPVPGRAVFVKPVTAAPLTSPPSISPQFDMSGHAWCEQCERRMGRAGAAACASAFCKLKAAR